MNADLLDARTSANLQPQLNRSTMQARELDRDPHSANMFTLSDPDDRVKLPLRIK